jgi:uncharacterized membrane protein YgdD (TMEM256/DUF423 family)
MTLGVVNVFCSMVAYLAALGLDDGAASLVRVGAGFQFMHSMSTFACATFMNIGAEHARLAPAFFLSGSLIFSASMYARAFGLWSGGSAPLILGAGLMAAGWGVLFVAARGIDREG